MNDITNAGPVSNNQSHNESNNKGLTGSSGNNMELEDRYILEFPANIQILSNVQNALQQIANQDVHQIVLNILFSFQRSLSILKPSFNNLGFFPPLFINLSEDNSVLIEWIFKTFRFGFAIEKDINESSWYYINKGEESENIHTGKLPHDNNALQLLIFSSINYAKDQV